MRISDWSSDVCSSDLHWSGAVSAQAACPLRPVRHSSPAPPCGFHTARTSAVSGSRPPARYQRARPTRSHRFPMSLLRLPSFQPLRREFEVFLCRCLRLFLERMKHQNPVFQRRQIDHPERARRFPDANFPNALPHGFHGLPVVGIVAALDKLKLPTGICSRIFGEGANIGLATSQPLYRSEEHTSELQSLMRISYAVFCLKKKKNQITINIHHQHLNQ